MGHAKYAWLFVIGVVIVILGIYFLIGRPPGIPQDLIVPRSFMIMIVGLMVTGVGAVYGRNRIRELSGYQPVVPIAEQKIEGPKPEVRLASQENPEPVQASTQPVLQPIEREVPPRVSQQNASSPPKRGGKRIIKVIICPHCGSENDEKNRFCFECGKPPAGFQPSRNRSFWKPPATYTFISCPVFLSIRCMQCGGQPITAISAFCLFSSGISFSKRLSPTSVPPNNTAFPSFSNLKCSGFVASQAPEPMHFFFSYLIM